MLLVLRVDNINFLYELICLRVIHLCILHHLWWWCFVFSKFFFFFVTVLEDVRDVKHAAFKQKRNVI